MKKLIKVTYEYSNTDGHSFVICERVQFAGAVARCLGTDEDGKYFEYTAFAASSLINIQAV